MIRIQRIEVKGYPLRDEFDPQGTVQRLAVARTWQGDPNPIDTALPKAEAAVAPIGGPPRRPQEEVNWLQARIDHLKIRIQDDRTRSLE